MELIILVLLVLYVYIFSCFFVVFAGVLMQENFCHLLLFNSCREVCHHPEAYVRKAVLFAAACVLVALHPTYISSALLEGNVEISTGLEWIRTWALDVAESDTDKECYTVSKRKFEASKRFRICVSLFLRAFQLSLLVLWSYKKVYILMHWSRVI